MRIVHCLLLLLAHCAEHSWSSVAMLDHIQQYQEEAAGREVMMAQVRQPGYVCTYEEKTDMYGYLVRQTVEYG